MKFEDAAEAAAKMVIEMDKNDDEANGVEVTENRARLALVGIRGELAAAGAAHVASIRTLRLILLLVFVIALELAIIIAR